MRGSKSISTGSRTIRSTTTASIRRAVISLPLKSTLLALTYSSPKLHPSSNQSKAEFTKQIATLGTLLNEIGNGTNAAPEHRQQLTTDALAVFVSTIYATGAPRRSRYLQQCRLDFKMMPQKHNLLALPAIMNEKGIPKEEAIQKVVKIVYAKPLITLLKAGKTILSVEQLKTNHGIGTISQEGAQRFTEWNQKLEERISQIQLPESAIEPGKDEMLIKKYLAEAAELAGHSDNNMLGVMEEIVGTQKTSELAAMRVVRK